MKDYGIQVDFPKPFRLDMLDHSHHGVSGGVYWRLSIGEEVAGYTSTTTDVDHNEVVEQIFRERKTSVDAWDSRPSTMVKNRFGTVNAMFLHPGDANDYITKAVKENLRDFYHMENIKGEKIVGVTGHGNAIMEKLREKGKI